MKRQQTGPAYSTSTKRQRVNLAWTTRSRVVLVSVLDRPGGAGRKTGHSGENEERQRAAHTPPRDRQFVASMSPAPAEFRRTEFDRRFDLRKPRTCHTRRGTTSQAAADDVVPARLTPDGVSDAQRHRLADETIGDHECQRRRLESSTQDAARCVRGRATTGRTAESSRNDGARNWLSNTLSTRYSGDMDTIIRNVHDIDLQDRSALEHMLGRKLREQQQVIIHLASVDTAEPMHAESSVTTATLPEWCHVFEGLSDRELAELDQVILDRADLTRPSE